MLEIFMPGIELYDEVLEEFTHRESFVLELEHSLVSISKWESIFEKPFLSKEQKSTEEVLSYIEAMIVTPHPSKEIVQHLSHDNLEAINKYIEAKMTATWFNETSQPVKNKEVITSELIYYWMISLQIPMECQHWHINRLFTLIRIFNIKNSKPKKMTRGEIMARNRELNAQRKAKLGTRG